MGISAYYMREISDLAILILVVPWIFPVSTTTADPLLIECLQRKINNKFA